MPPGTISTEPTRGISFFDDVTTTDMPSISRIFQDAALYERVLAAGGDLTVLSSISDEAEHSDEDDSALNGFADLVGRDLDTPEQAITARLAKINVAGDTWTPGELTAEPESYEDDSESSSVDTKSEDTLYDDRHVLEKWSVERGHEEPELVEAEESANITASPSVQHADTAVEESWKLSPEEIVQLLCSEFGPLAGEGEKERLLLEADGAFFQDVTIIGVIHLTTHRLAFHASLLATRPDLLPTQQILKSGPATLRRKGLHKKRRVWMELSHDMLSTYASSSDEDHIRPLRSVMLSCVKEVGPFDPKHPKRLVLVFDSTEQLKEGVAKFDNEESARDWRKELKGALFVYRHTRREALSGNVEELSNGVRMSIPLSRISRFDFKCCLSLMYVVSLHLDVEDGDIQDAMAYNRTTDTVRIVTVRPDQQWMRLGEYVDAAKARPRPSSDSILYPNLIVDFGPLSFLETAHYPRYPGYNVQDDKEKAVRKALALVHEPDVWFIRSRIRRAITSTGYFALSAHFLGFWSRYFAQSDIRYRLALSTIKAAKPIALNTKLLYARAGKLLHLPALRLEIDGQDDLKFEFRTAEIRDEAVRRINAAVEADRQARTQLSGQLTPTSAWDSAGSTGLPGSPTRSATRILAPLSRTLVVVSSGRVPESVRAKLPKSINVPRNTLYTPEPQHFVCLTIGSRGDVQPYIALGLGLKKEGHTVTIVTHEEYKVWVEGFGITHRTAGGDPGALMKLSVENKMFSPEFFKESLANFRPWLDALLRESWEQCQDADVLLESPSAMAGVHIAEALNIPYFRCFTMPWTKFVLFYLLLTLAVDVIDFIQDQPVPHAFLSPPVDSPTFNSASYVLFDNVMWTATSGQINRWRRKTLHIESTDMGHLAQSKITFIYNFSTAVVPKPLDWGDTIIISGYWFLDNPDLDWTPPAALVEWMAKARNDGKPIVYIGFGSITVPNPHTVTEHIVKAVLKSDVRAIISKGWSARMSKQNYPEVEIPPECYQLDKVPHDWLFPQIDAAMHHGGAGTTGASLRAGIPTLIKPWFGDQYFWASRVQKLGAGLRVSSLRVNDLAEALTKATTNRLMKEKAASIGERIRAEDGVHSAINAIYTWLPRASRDRQSLD